MRKLLIVLVLLSSAFAKDKPAKAASEVPGRALLQQILDTWTGPNIDSVAQFYDQSPDDVFFDLTPLKYDGFANYLSGVKNVVTGFDSLRFTVNDDVYVHDPKELVDLFQGPLLQQHPPRMHQFEHRERGGCPSRAGT